MSEQPVVDAMNCATDDPPDGALALPELAGRLCAGAVAISASTAAWLLLVAEFDRREGWAVPGVTSCAHWLSWQCGIAPGTARDHVRLARALPGLPRVTADLGAGRISYAKARAIARVADADSEPALLELARNCTAAQLDRVVAGWRRADTAATEAARAQAEDARSLARAATVRAGGTDDEGAEAGRAAAAAVWTSWWPDGADPDRTPARWEQRLDWTDEGDGSVTVRLRLAAEDAAEVIAAVEHRAEVLTRRDRSARRAEGGGDRVVPLRWAEWSAGQDLVDGGAPGRREAAALRRARVTVARTAALLDLVRAGAVAADRQPTDPARRELLVRVDAAVLADDTAAGQAVLDGVASLSPAQARRLACDAAVTTVLVDHGQVLAAGRSRRYASAAQRRALLVRDGGCVRPGCTETRPERLHAHHLVSWLAGGRTDVDNLVLLCDRCHGLVHDLDLLLHRDDGQLVVRTTEGTAVWTQLTPAGEDPGPPVDLPSSWRANGERLDLRHAIGVVLDHRAVLRRQRRAERSPASTADAA
ncbi:HNH endonuclease signature motif containing protein [Modestobacter sp. Leaf380]|uniref:HNH endonuclease signature motif containing protein n=1 Tax=Modestobacter sp. Leaf380 TaxID=1736356 RepID=UPI001F3A20DF|nr:HNH endonuclease signature motif containing protein [Modestobacter sp. Leaf380]